MMTTTTTFVPFNNLQKLQNTPKDTLNPKVLTKFWEDGLKVQAKIILAPCGIHKIIIPTQEEWIGVNLLERDGEL